MIVHTSSHAVTWQERRAYTAEDEEWQCWHPALGEIVIYCEPEIDKPHSIELHDVPSLGRYEFS